MLLLPVLPLLSLLPLRVEPILVLARHELASGRLDLPCLELALEPHPECLLFHLDAALVGVQLRAHRLQLELFAGQLDLLSFLVDDGLGRERT